MSKEINSKILIIGGEGFIGSSLILALQDKYKILCLDRGKKYSDLKKFVNDNVELIKGDITDEVLLDNLCKDCYAIIHLAGGGGNSACAKDPIWAINTHILGTHSVLKKALEHKVKKFIFSSSQFVYTTFHKTDFLLKENMLPEPDDFYGTLKRIAENLIIDSGINYSILRLANVYGVSKLYPAQERGAINNFVNSAFNKEKLQIYGSGSQVMDYVYLKDVVRAFISVLEKENTKDIYNVGSGELIRLEEITKIVHSIFKDKFKQETEIEKISVDSDEIWPDRLMSIEKIRKDLSWEPEISLKQGLGKMINSRA